MKGIRSVFLFTILFIAGCTTVTDNVIEATIGKEDYRKIEEIDLLILEYKINNNISDLDTAGLKLKDMIADKAYNKEYEATLYGLAGEIEYLRNNKQGVRTNLIQVEKRSKSVEYFYLLTAFLEDDPAKRIEILEQGAASANSKGKIDLYLAFYYFEANNFVKATACFDDAFDLLPPKYKEYYVKDRELAYQLMKNPLPVIDIKDLLEKEAVSFSNVIRLTLLQTDFLNHITADKNADPETLLGDLKSHEYIHESIKNTEEVCARKDIAYFLLSIMSYMENDPGMKDKYQNQFLENDQSSPVPDVRVSDYYFNAVLVLVESEIMELPNGIHFLPYKTMSGIEFNELLMKIKDRYY
jgi:tetratricopeptide (TPR) repeat protein